MNNQHNNNEKVRVAQKEQVRHLFSSLKTLALGMAFAGFCLIFGLYLVKIDPLAEMTILLLFGISSGGYIIARGRSILLSYEEKKKENQHEK